MSKRNESNLELLRLAAAGDTDAKHQLIDDSMGMVVAVANQTLSDYPTFSYYRNDLVGDLTLKLVDLIDRITKRVELLERIHNYSGYVFLALKNEALKKLAKEEPAFFGYESYSRITLEDAPEDAFASDRTTHDKAWLDIVALADEVAGVGSMVEEMSFSGRSCRSVSAEFGLDRTTAQRKLDQFKQAYEEHYLAS